MAFLAFTAIVLLVMGWGSPALSFFTVHVHILVFAATSTAVVSLRISGVLVSSTLPSIGVGFLRWTVTFHLSPLLAFADGRGGPGVLGFLRSCSSQFPSSSFHLASPLVLEGDFVTYFCLIYIYVLFYVFVSVFFPNFCTGLLLHGCYI